MSAKQPLRIETVLPDDTNYSHFLVNCDNSTVLSNNYENSINEVKDRIKEVINKQIKVDTDKMKSLDIQHRTLQSKLDSLSKDDIEYPSISEKMQKIQSNFYDLDLLRRHYQMLIPK